MSSADSTPISESSDSDQWLINVMGYVPNVAAAAIFFVMYALVAVAFSYQAVRTRTGFTLILAITGMLEAIGYATRIQLSKSPSLGIFIASQLLILLAPNALALVNYKVLGQIIKLKQQHINRVSQEVSRQGYGGTVQRIEGGLQVNSRCHLPWLMDSTGLIRGDRVAKLFFASDVLAFLIQSAGGGQEAQASTAEMGKAILLFGLILQTIFYALFTALAVYVYRSPRYRTQLSNSEVNEALTIESHLCEVAFKGLFVTVGLLTTRNVYRLIEDIGGRTGYVAAHESFMYIFDALAILLTFGVFFYYKLGSSLTMLLRQQTENSPLEFEKSKLAPPSFPTSTAYSKTGFHVLESDSV